MSYQENRYTHIRDAWNEAHARGLSPLEALVYRSNRLGEDRRITNTGGGSTSLKVMEKDPVSGESVEIIWIKSAGQDLRASRRSHFSPLYQDKLVALRESYQPQPRAKAEKTLAERIRAAAFNRAASEPSAPSAPSVDTPLHALMPYAHVSHIHPNSAIAVGACKNSRSLTTAIWGENMLWVPRGRPGFEQGIPLQEAWSQQPDATGALLAGNGIATWSDDNRLCYQQTLDIIEAASRYIAARDRGEQTFGGQRYANLDEVTRQSLLASILRHLTDLVSGDGLVATTVESGPETMRFVNSADAPRLANEGVACMHHLRLARLKPLYVDWDPQSDTLETLQRRLEQGLQTYRHERRAHDEAHRQHPGQDDPSRRRSTAPWVYLIPGIGLIAVGRCETDSRVTAEAYQSAIEVMRCAEAIDTYVGLTERDARDIEYRRR